MFVLRQINFGQIFYFYCVKMNSDLFSATNFSYEGEFDPNVTLLCAFVFLEYFKLQLQKNNKTQHNSKQTKIHSD